METTAYTERTCIIVVEIHGESGSVPMGIVVDAVSEVLNIRGGRYRRHAHLRGEAQHGLHPGDGQDGGGVKILLDIDKVLGARSSSRFSDL